MVADSCCAYRGYSMIIRDYDEFLIDLGGIESANIGYWYDDSYRAYGMQRAVVMRYSTSSSDGNHTGTPDQTRSALPFLAQNTGSVVSHGSYYSNLTTTQRGYLQAQLNYTYTTGGAINKDGSGIGHYFVMLSYNSGTQLYYVHDTKDNNKQYISGVNAFENGLSIFGRSDQVIRWFDYLN